AEPEVETAHHALEGNAADAAMRAGRQPAFLDQFQFGLVTTGMVLRPVAYQKPEEACHDHTRQAVDEQGRPPAAVVNLEEVVGKGGLQEQAIAALDLLQSDSCR